MPKTFIIFFLIFTCAGIVPAQVIQYEIDPSFNSELLFSRGSVSDVLHTSIDQYLIMGMFNNPSLSSGLISADGSLVYPNVVGGQKVAEYLQGFLSFGSGIKHVELGLGLTSFRFEFSKQAYSGPLTTKALDAIVMSDDNILVAGRFFTDSTLMGTPQSHLGLRQLCMIDSTGAPVPGFPMLRCAEPVNAEIRTINQLSTGEYIIAGTFSEVDGYFCPKVAKLNADFSVNTDFVSPFGTSGTGVSTTLIDSEDRLWVIFGPNMTLVGEPDYLSRNARLLADGSIDQSFTAPVCTGYFGGTYENPTTPTNIAAGVIEDEDGTFILHGQFIEINGAPYRRLAKIQDDGAVIIGAMQYTTPDSAVWGGWDDGFGPIMSASARVVKKLPDGKLLIGGQFSSFGGEPYSCLVRLQPNGFVGTDDKEGRGKLKLWPNPVGYSSAGFGSAQPAVVRIALPDENEQIDRVEIVDLQGRIVRGYPGDEISNELDLNGLNAGIYLVRAWSEKGVYTQKLILQ